jgi:type III secretory pathway component EscR
MAEDNHQVMFMQLVMQNQQMAMISLGKVKNPVSDRVEKNLEYAKISIDTLDMLIQKTKGNLSDYEEKFLTETVNQLKIIFVEESANEEILNKESKEKE